MSYGLFEHDVIVDEGARLAARQSVAVAHKRAHDAFGTFLSAADGDFEARLDLVADDLKQVVAEVVDEYGGDAEKVEAAVVSSFQRGSDWSGLERGEDGRWRAPQSVEQGDGPDINSELSEAPSAVAESITASREVLADSPFSNLTNGLGDVGKGFSNGFDELKQAVDPNRGFIPSLGDLGQAVGDVGSGVYKGLGNNNTFATPNSAGEAQAATPLSPTNPMAPAPSPDELHTWFSQNHAPTGGGQQYNPAAHTQENYNQVAQHFNMDPQQVQQGLQQFYQNSGHPNATQMASPAPGLAGQPLSPNPPFNPAQQKAIDPRDPNTLDPTKTGARHEAEALTTEKLPKGDDTALGGPSPKMDKSRWTELDPIKTEGKGSPNPTTHQDISEVADHTKDFLEQTDAVTKSEDVGRESDIDTIHTDTWSGTEGQADAVTSATQDPDRNPIRDLIEQGFIPENQVTAAISRFNGRDAS